MNVVAVVAHPDDESLLMGGTLAKHAQAGDLVVVFAMSDGVGSRHVECSAEYMRERSRRDAAFVSAITQLGVSGAIEHIFQDQRSDAIDQLVINQNIGCLLHCDVGRVYTHYPHDLNIDHRRVAEAVLVETRGRCPVYCAEPEFSSRALVPFEPHIYVPIDIEKKLAACACYTDELREYPHPRSLRAIQERALRRGPASEAFVVYV